MENAICDGDKTRKPFRRGHKPHGAKSGCCRARNNSGIGWSCNIGHSLVGPHYALSRRNDGPQHMNSCSRILGSLLKKCSLLSLTVFCMHRRRRSWCESSRVPNCRTGATATATELKRPQSGLGATLACGGVRRQRRRRCRNLWAAAPTT